MSILKALGTLVDEVTNATSNRTPLEKKLDEALSKQNWGASATLLREIAYATSDP
jgi:hypothetical protein